MNRKYVPSIKFDNNKIDFYTESIHQFADYNKNIDKLKEQFPNCEITITYCDPNYREG